MPGPKPDVRVSFERINLELSRINRASRTDEQRQQLRRIVEIIRNAELLWIKPNLAMPVPEPQSDGQGFVPRAIARAPETPIEKAYREGTGGGVNPFNADDEQELYTAFLEGRTDAGA